MSPFAGLRPTEIARLTWSRVDLKEGTITLDGSMAKTRQRRIVKLPENAIAWLFPQCGSGNDVHRGMEEITTSHARQQKRAGPKTSLGAPS